MTKKVVENRVRRALSRRGLILSKTRRRDPKARDFDGYMIIDADTNSVVAGGTPFAFSMSLFDVEEWLKA